MQVKAVSSFSRGLNRLIPRRKIASKAQGDKQMEMPKEDKQFWKDVCETISIQEAQEVLKRLDMDYICGFQLQPEKYPCYEEYAGAKRRFSNMIVLMQVGQFYETQGIDSVVMAEYRFLNFMGSDVRAGIPMQGIQSVCDKLILDGFRVAVYEEVKLQTARGYMRKLAQVVSRANPTFKSTKVKVEESSIFEMNSSSQIIGIWKKNQQFDLYRCNPGIGVVHVIKGLKQIQIRSFLYSSLIVLPVFLYDIDPQDEEGKELVSMIQEAAGTKFLHLMPLEEEGADHFVKQIQREFPGVVGENIGIKEGNCRCLDNLTMGSLGLKFQEGIPDLLDTLLGRQNQVARSYFREILLSPPTYKTCKIFHWICEYFQRTSDALPIFCLSLTPYKFQSAVNNGGVTSPAVLREVEQVLRCMVELHQSKDKKLYRQFLDLALEKNGVELEEPVFESYCRVMLGQIGMLLKDVQEEVEMSFQLREQFSNLDAGSLVKIEQFLWQKESSIYGCVSAKLIKEEIEQLTKCREAFLDKLLLILQQVAADGKQDLLANYFGQFDQAGVIALTQVYFVEYINEQDDYITFYDKQGVRAYMSRELHDLWEDYDAAIKEAILQINYKYEQLIINLTHQNSEFLQISLTINMIGGTFLQHVNKVFKFKWCVPTLLPPLQKKCLQVKKLLPYYLEKANQEDGFDIELSSISILTGPNMSGKSTMLRSITALVLLANCGFMVPCQYASVPFYDQIIYLGYTSDAPIDDLSGFGQECQNLSQMNKVLQGTSFICCDEFGRSTQALYGASLLLATVYELIQNGHYGVFATHYASQIKNLMESNNLKLNDLQFFKIDVEKNDQGTERFLTEGVSYDSQAFEVARNFKVDESAVELAERLYKQLKSV